MDLNPFSVLSRSPPGSDTTDPDTMPQSTEHSVQEGVEEASSVNSPTKQGSLGERPMPVDENGAMIHEGMRDPGFIMDCMEWGILDSATGAWVDQCPPLHYFNVLRLWVWLHEQKPPNPQNMREIRLPSTREVNQNGEIHVSALRTAYALWADAHLRQEQFGADPLPPPASDADAQIWTDEKAKFPSIPMSSSQEVTRSPEPGGVSISQPSSSHSSRSKSLTLLTKMADLDLTRSDSVLAGFDVSTSPTASFYATHRPRSTSAGSPIQRLFTRPNVSASANDFKPPFGHGCQTVNPALSSHAALPGPADPLPGTFDVFYNGKSSNFICLNVADAPFNVSVNEILTHLKLGEREGLVFYGSDNPAIHIIQDRADSKTHEVYVEMLSWDAAQRVLRDIPRRGIKIGSTGSSRKIRVSICKTQDMMNAIFPRPTRNHPRQFQWIGPNPVLHSIPDDFIGYVSSEDLHNARDWAEHPRKAKHAEDAPQRVYEFMITTLIHLPKDPRAYGNLKGWTSLQEFVDRLFATCVGMIRTLNNYLDDPKFAERHLRKEHSHLLHFRLLKRFNQTCFDFPLFSDEQKLQLFNGV